MDIELQNGKYLNINLYEIRPEEDVFNNPSILEAFFIDCQCALFLIDMTDYKTFNSIKKLFVIIGYNKYPYLKKILVENKSDIGPKELNKEIYNYINDNPEIGHITISAKDGKNLDKLLLKIYDEFNSPEKISLPINQILKNSFKINTRDIPKEKFKGSFSLIFMGNTGVGKTNFISRYTKNFFQPLFLSTHGYDEVIKILKIKDENNNYNYYKLRLLDTVGQEKFKSLPRTYYKKADGILLLFDVNDIETFEDVSAWMSEINENKSQDERDYIIYLIGNKIDFGNSDSQEVNSAEGDTEKIPVTKKEKEELKNRLGVKYFEISCKWNLNIEEVITNIIYDCINNKIETPTTQSKKVINIKRKKKKCC